MTRCIQKRHQSQVLSNAYRPFETQQSLGVIRAHCDRTRNAILPQIMHGKKSRTIDLVFEEWLTRVPKGWRGLMVRMLSALSAVIVSDASEITQDPNASIFEPQTPTGGHQSIEAVEVARQRALLSLILDLTGAEFEYTLVLPLDRVVTGILRKARVASRSTCMDCGMPGRARQLTIDEIGCPTDDEPVSVTRVGSRTLCACCAAPMLLHQNLVLLKHSIKCVRHRDGPVTPFDVPPLLHPSFLMACTKQRQQPPIFKDGHGDDNGDESDLEVVPVLRRSMLQMNQKIFLEWAQEWIDAGVKLKLESD